jgi:hypothetical protein
MGHSLHIRGSGGGMVYRYYSHVYGSNYPDSYLIIAEQRSGYYGGYVNPAGSFSSASFEGVGNPLEVKEQPSAFSVASSCSDFSAIYRKNSLQWIFFLISIIRHAVNERAFLATSFRGLVIL